MNRSLDNVLAVIGSRGLKITAPAAGDTFDIGSARCTILAPNSEEYNDPNNYSIVIKLEYGQTAFLSQVTLKLRRNGDA